MTEKQDSLIGKSYKKRGGAFKKVLTVCYEKILMLKSESLGLKFFFSDYKNNLCLLYKNTEQQIGENYNHLDSHHIDNHC